MPCATSKQFEPSAPVPVSVPVRVRSSFSFSLRQRETAREAEPERPDYGARERGEAARGGRECREVRRVPLELLRDVERLRVGRRRRRRLRHTVPQQRQQQ